MRWPRPANWPGKPGYSTDFRISQGPRSLAIVRDTRGNVTSISDGMRTSTFTYDDAGRVKTQTLPGGQAIINFGYDANGNVTSITPPGRTAHGFTYTPLDLADSYTPPAVPEAGATLMQYNADRQLSLITRPDGAQLTPGYDGGGRLAYPTRASPNHGARVSSPARRRVFVHPSSPLSLCGENTRAIPRGANAPGGTPGLTIYRSAAAEVIWL